MLGVDLVNNPDLVATDPSIAARTAVAFWTTRPKLRAASQAGDMVKVTKIVNGGAIGIENRTKLFKQYMQTMAEGKFDDMLSGKTPAVEGGDGPASPA
ncbi:glycoside hydrolase family 19 protein, partial [Providencia rettgeri]